MWSGWSGWSRPNTILHPRLTREQSVFTHSTIPDTECPHSKGQLDRNLLPACRRPRFQAPPCRLVTQTWVVTFDRPGVWSASGAMFGEGPESSVAGPRA